MRMPGRHGDRKRLASVAVTQCQRRACRNAAPPPRIVVGARQRHVHRRAWRPPSCPPPPPAGAETAPAPARRPWAAFPNRAPFHIRRTPFVLPVQPSSSPTTDTPTSPRPTKRPYPHTTETPTATTRHLDLFTATRAPRSVTPGRRSVQPQTTCRLQPRALLRRSSLPRRQQESLPPSQWSSLRTLLRAVAPRCSLLS